jgi:hypothetical protein
MSSPFLIALERYERLCDFITGVAARGAMSDEDAEDVLLSDRDTFERYQEIRGGNTTVSLSMAQLIRATGEIQRKFIERCPQLAENINALIDGPAR